MRGGNADDADLELIWTPPCAIDNEEHVIGLNCVAATIYEERTQVVAVLLVSDIEGAGDGPAYRGAWGTGMPDNGDSDERVGEAVPG